MVVQAHHRFTQLLLAACAFAACQSGPTLKRSLTVHEGELTRVRLLAGAGSLTLSLENASVAAPATVYGATSTPADLGRKVVDDADLQALLDVWSERGMFEASLPDVPPDARDVLVVEQGGRRWLWARRQAGVQLAEQGFHEARAYFLALYNSSIAYHGSGSERPNFAGENVRAKTSAESARLRLETLRGAQR